MIVVDANVLMAVHFQGPATAAARAALLFDREWLAPPLWRSELRSGLLKYVRHGALDRAVAVAMMEEAERVVVRERFAAAPLVLELALRSGCSAYDCEYVGLALELGTRLITLDRRVLKSFPRVATDPATFAA